MGQAGMSVPDKAAKLVAAYERAQAEVERLRAADAGSNWTTFSLAVDDAMGIAHEGMRQAWVALDRWTAVAKEAADRAADGQGA